MKIARIAAVIAAALAATPGVAGPVGIAVRGIDGRPLAGAVVTLDMPGVAAPTPRGPYSVEQKDIQFQPRVLIVPVGATVAFPNRDRVRHHVYSFSKPKRFDLKLYGREENRSVILDKPGAVTLGCNIHDAMNGVVYVVTTPFAAQSDAGGRVSLGNAPAGRGVVRVWHPSIRAPGNVASQPVTVTAAGLSTTFQIGR